MRSIENKTFEEIRVGDTASVQRTLQAGDVRAWATAFGDVDLLAEPSHGDGAAGIVTALLTSLVGSALPGPGSCVRSTTIQTRAALPIDNVLTAKVVVREKRADEKLVVLDGECTDSTGKIVATSMLEVLAPSTRVRRDLSACKIVSTENAEDSAAKAAAAAGAGEVHTLMKGSLHTDVLLHAVMQKEAKLRTGHLLSHCAIISVPTYARRIVITDVALNIAPDTDQKRDICQNAIGFARALGIDVPKVAVLAAVETVRTKMPATLDGAILAKMADRRQIVGGIVDGPLDLDAAVDPEAARIKHIFSPVAGLADVLIVPNIEAGNMVYKDLAFMADAQTAGLVVGARVPIVLTSRADTAPARRFSAAAAVLYANSLAHDPNTILPETAE
jgi:phosphotransacetylase